MLIREECWEPVVNKSGNGGEMWNRIARECFKNNIVFTTPLNFAAGVNAFRVSKQNNA